MGMDPEKLLNEIMLPEGGYTNIHETTAGKLVEEVFDEYRKRLDSEEKIGRSKGYSPHMPRTQGAKYPSHYEPELPKGRSGHPPHYERVVINGNVYELDLYVEPSPIEPEGWIVIGRGEGIKVTVAYEQIPQLLNALFNLMKTNRG